MEGLAITKTILTSHAASNIIQTAIDAGSHGIGYWARVLKIQQIRSLDGSGEMLNAAIVFEDIEGTEPGQTPKRCKVHATDIARAMTKILADPIGTGAGKVAGRIVTEDYVDGPTADVIMQVACFGKVLYG